jgi:hypothetical protein
MGGRICAAAAALLVFAAPAAAEPASGPHETIDQNFTASTPATPTGLGWSSTYHAAGDAGAPPPPMKKMVFYPPAGFHYDTSVPGRCTASDAELSLRGPAACPADSRLGDGTTEGLFLVSSTTIPAYTNAKGSYATTPPTCPAEGYWTTTVRFWCADGTTDSVDSHQPCTS